MKGLIQVYKNTLYNCINHEKLEMNKMGGANIKKEKNDLTSLKR